MILQRLRIVFLFFFIWIINGFYYKTVASTHQLPSFFYKGYALYEQGYYRAAKKYLSQYTAQQPSKNIYDIDAQYYLALCALQLNIQATTSTQPIEQFIAAYPTHWKTQYALWHLGGYHFYHQQFQKSLFFYHKIDTTYLQNKRNQLFYHMGYASLRIQQFEQAFSYFSKVNKKHKIYAPITHYYAGYILLRQKKYEQALSFFNLTGLYPTYQKIVPYMIVQVYYRQKKFVDLLIYLNEIKNSNIFPNNQIDFYFFAAESYFFLKQYAKAAQAYTKYFTHNKPDKNSGLIYYRAAYAFEKNRNFKKAVCYYKIVAMDSCSIGQMASYTLGKLYLAQGNQRLALGAFQKAAQNSCMTHVREEAMLQCAKIWYNEKNFTAAIDMLSTFQDQYPASKHKYEVVALLSKAYYKTNNYDYIINYIKKLPFHSKQTMAIYQKATFYKGTALFNDGFYKASLSWLHTSLKHAEDHLLRLQALLWIGESLSALKNYSEAIIYYQKILSLGSKNEACYKQALYSLAYAYFNIGAYQQAISKFESYIPIAMDSASAHDVLVRLADCFYATKKYKKALTLYDKSQIHKSCVLAHIYYHQGIIYGILGKKNTAQKFLKIILKDYIQTSYYEHALWHTALLELESGNYIEAVNKFTTFMEKLPCSTLLPKALLNRAIAYGSLQQYQAAQKDCAFILRHYATDIEAKSALLELQKLLTLTAQPTLLNTYLDMYKAANPADNSLKKINFETGKMLFYNQQYTSCITSLKQFLVKYPTSCYSIDAHFFIGEAYYRLEDDEQAVLYYQHFLAKKEDKKNQKILKKLAAIYYRQKKYKEALHMYQKIQNYIQTTQAYQTNLLYIMKLHHALLQYDSVAYCAQRLIVSPSIPLNMIHEAKLALGKVAMHKKNWAKAVDHFKQIIHVGQKKYAVEAYYLLAMVAYKEKKYELSLEWLFQLNQQFSMYPKWKNCAFSLIADNYIALRALPQAQATLQSIIEHSQDSSLIAQANNKLMAILKQYKNIELDTIQ